MGENIIINNEEEVLPPVADTSIPLTPDVPIDITEPIDTTVIETPIEKLPAEVDKVGNFFGTIQESVTIAWRYHLKTHKHYVHVATQEYYYKALNLVDKIIEEYQGDSGTTIENYVNCIFDGGKSEIDYFNELKTFVTLSKTEIIWKEEIISDIDELLGTIDSTLYKLTSFMEHAIKSFDEFCFEDYEVIGVEGGVEGTFDNVTKTTNSQQGAGDNLGVEGGVEGTFDNVTKTTTNNLVPTKDSKSKCKDDKCECDKKNQSKHDNVEEDEEEE